MKEYISCRKVLKSYDIGNNIRINVMSGGTANKNYRIITESGCYVLRCRNKKYSSSRQMRFEQQYLEHLSGYGISVPLPIKNIHGSFKTTLNDNAYQLFPFLEGESFKANDEAQIISAGRFLGRLHNALEDFGVKPWNDGVRYDDPRHMKTSLEEALESRACDIDSAQKHIIMHITDCIQRLIRELPDSVYNKLPPRVIHGDYHPANVKYRDNDVCCLFDFDRIARLPRLRDVVDGIMYYTVNRDSKLDGGDIFSLTKACIIDIEKCNQFLGAYQHSCMETLSAQEIKMVPRFLLARMINSRIEALAKVPQNQAMAMLTGNMLNILKWIGENENMWVESMMTRLKMPDNSSL